MNTLLPTSDADARAAQEFECFVCNRTLPIDNVECKLAQGPVCKGCANHLDIDFIKRSQQIEGQQDECNACGAIEESEQDIEELVLASDSNVCTLCGHPLMLVSLSKDRNHYKCNNCDACIGRPRHESLADDNYPDGCTDEDIEEDYARKAGLSAEARSDSKERSCAYDKSYEAKATAECANCGLPLCSSCGYIVGEDRLCNDCYRSFCRPIPDADSYNSNEGMEGLLPSSVVKKGGRWY